MKERYRLIYNGKTFRLGLAAQVAFLRDFLFVLVFVSHWNDGPQKFEA